MGGGWPGPSHSRVRDVGLCSARNRGCCYWEFCGGEFSVVGILLFFFVLCVRWVFM